MTASQSSSLPPSSFTTAATKSCQLEGKCGPTTARDVAMVPPSTSSGQCATIQLLTQQPHSYGADGVQPVEISGWGGVLQLVLECR